MNWSFYRFGWSISWFNIKNLREDDYLKKYNQGYQENKRSYFRKIFHLNYGEYGIELSHVWNHSHLIWIAPKNLYWCVFRDSPSFSSKGKWCFRLKKTTNDHTSGC